MYRVALAIRQTMCGLVKRKGGRGDTHPPICPSVLPCCVPSTRPGALRFDRVPSPHALAHSIFLGLPSLSTCKRADLRRPALTASTHALAHRCAPPLSTCNRTRAHEHTTPPTQAAHSSTTPYVVDTHTLGRTRGGLKGQPRAQAPCAAVARRQSPSGGVGRATSLAAWSRTPWPRAW